MFESGYPTMGVLEEELADKIAELVKSESEIDEYLQLLEKENSELVGVLIYQELFYMVSKRIENKQFMKLEKEVQDFLKSDATKEDKEMLLKYTESLRMICSAIEQGLI